MSKVQPAKISYFFGKGYTDLGNTIKGAWVRNIVDIKGQWEEVRENGLFSFRGFIAFIAVICIAVFGSIITAVVTVVHVAVLAFIFVIVYISFSILWLIDRIYMLIHRISNACPNPGCQAKFLLPAYKCPTCGRVHTMLTPSKYGILHRTCLCGTKLPTTFINGRSKLPAFCPECGESLAGDTGSRQYAIPVIGGPAVGKTCMINMAVRKMMTEIAPANQWEMTFATDTEKIEFDAIVGGMEKGIRPQKTDKDALTAYQLMIHLPNDKIGRRLYIYDISGEMFSESGTIQRNRAFSYADGFVFLIDPLTIPDFAMKVVDRIDVDSYGASTKDFDDIFDIMLTNLQTLFGLKPDDVLKRDLAVVINKCDIPGLEEEIGDSAVQEYMAQNSDCKSTYEARNAVCKRFLDSNGEGNFVREADGQFRKVQYFTCSALGHNKEGVAFEGVHTEAPFLWILQRKDSKMKVAGI